MSGDMWGQENAGALWAAMMAFGVLFFVFWIYLQWRIFSKAGFNGALALINFAIFVPFVGALIVFALQVWFAFAAWPALNKPSQS